MVLNAQQRDWVNALQCGDFKQTHSTLYAPSLDAYCCLGVACVVAERFEIKIDREEETNYIIGDELGDQEEAKKFLGVTTKGERILVHLNDVVKLDFSQIADFIRKFPELIFEEPKEENL